MGPSTGLSISLSNEFLASPRDASLPAKFPYGPSICRFGGKKDVD